MADLADLQASDEAAFVQEDVEKIAMDCIEEVLGEEKFDEKQTHLWVDRICQQTLEQLNSKQKPFKYVVHAIVAQDVGADWHTAYSMFCDGANDGVAVAQWPTDKSKDEMQCVVTVFGLALFSR